MAKCMWESNLEGGLFYCHTPEAPDYDNGTHCIFHAEKKDSKVCEEFKSKFEEYWKSCQSENQLNFSGFIFPDGFPLPPAFPKDKEVIFMEAKFQEADFRLAKFQEADFVGAEFQEADFSWAEFQGKADFRGAKFQEANFSEAEFQGSADFRVAKFQCSPDFWEAEFQDKALFQSVTFTEPEKVVFDKVDLSRCLFLNTDLTKIDFRDVRWDKNPLKRRAVRDEWDEGYEWSKQKNDWVRKEEPKAPDFIKIGQLYRELRKNYEGKLRYDEVGHFYIGQMEMRRRAKWFLFKWFSPIAFYKLFSRYGTSYWRPLGWLVGFILAFAFLYFLTGIKASFSDAFMLSVNSCFLIFFRVESVINCEGQGTQLLTRLESVIGPVLITLLVLAVRWNFKR